MNSDLLGQTYELRGDAPPAMPVEAYIDRVTTEWTALLESDPAEPEVQAFLETHPVMVPGAHLGIGQITPTGHAPFPQALITQPLLQGITRRTPDFLWLATDSLVFNPVFVEIEAPRKPWAISTGQQHSLLTQALEQITDWKEWLSNTANREIFFETYQIPRRIRQRAWSPVFVLVYGRKEESRDAVARIRRRHLGTDTFLVPYEKPRAGPGQRRLPVRALQFWTLRGNQRAAHAPARPRVRGEQATDQRQGGRHSSVGLDVSRAEGLPSAAFLKCLVV